jgi:hypothetical protein
MKAAEIVVLSFVLACASLNLSAGGLPNSPGDLPDAIFNRPKFFGRIGGMVRVAVRGDIVFLADGYAGLGVYSLTDPENPRLMGAYSTGEYTYSVSVDGDRADTFDSLNGTVAFDVRDPLRLRRVALSEVRPDEIARALHGEIGIDGGDMQGVAAIVGNRVYLARHDRDVVVIEMRSPPDIPPPPFRTRVIIHRAAMPGFASSAVLQALQPGSASLPPGPAIQANAAVVSLDDAFAPADESVVSISATTTRLQLKAGIETGRLKLWISGPIGQPVRVQRSPTLLGDWEDWQTITLGDAPSELTDEEAAGADQTFYRAVSR